MKPRRWSMLRLMATLIAFLFVVAACGTADDVAETADDVADEAEEAVEEVTEDDDDEEAMEEEEEQVEAPEEEAMADASGASFVSLQFAPVEEAEKFREILAPAEIEVTIGEEGPTIDQILAGAGEIDVVGGLHGTFPTLADEGALTNMADVLDDLGADRKFAQSFVDAGLLGTDDNLAYVPWAQATYIMAANKEALPYLPEGADVDNLTWDQLAEWCQAIADGEGENKCGLPKAGLFHRFLEGYMWPSYTGGMVSEFRSAEAEEMMTYLRDDLWPTMNPESLNYEFMQEPLQSGEVWVAFDHVARLVEAFNADPEAYVAFPTPSGPAGRGFMPVIVGLGIPADAPNPEAAAAVIDYLTTPEVQAQVLGELAFFPVIEGVDVSALPEGVQLEAEAVDKLANADDALPALLPVGLGERGGDINQIYRDAFDRVVVDGDEIATVLSEEGDKLATLMEETGAPCWAPDPASDGPCPVN